MFSGDGGGDESGIFRPELRKPGHVARRRCGLKFVEGIDEQHDPCVGRCLRKKHGEGLLNLFGSLSFENGPVGGKKTAELPYPPPQERINRKGPGAYACGMSKEKHFFIGLKKSIELGKEGAFTGAGLTGYAETPCHRGAARRTGESRCFCDNLISPDEIEGSLLYKLFERLPLLLLP